MHQPQDVLQHVHLPQLRNNSDIFLFHYHLNNFLQVNFNCSKIYFRSFPNLNIHLHLLFINITRSQCTIFNICLQMFLDLPSFQTPSLITPPMPFANLIEACSSSPTILVFFQVYIYQNCKNHKTKQNKVSYQHKKINKISTLTPTTKPHFREVAI